MSAERVVDGPVVHVQTELNGHLAVFMALLRRGYNPGRVAERRGNCLRNVAVRWQDKPELFLERRHRNPPIVGQA